MVVTHHISEFFHTLIRCPLLDETINLLCSPRWVRTTITKKTLESLFRCETKLPIRLWDRLSFQYFYELITVQIYDFFLTDKYICDFYLKIIKG